MHWPKYIYNTSTFALSKSGVLVKLRHLMILKCTLGSRCTMFVVAFVLFASTWLANPSTYQTICILLPLQTIYTLFIRFGDVVLRSGYVYGNITKCTTYTMYNLTWLCTHCYTEHCLFSLCTHCCTEHCLFTLYTLLYWTLSLLLCTHCCSEHCLFTLYTLLKWTLSLFTLYTLLYWTLSLCNMYTLSLFTVYTSLYWTVSFYSIHIAVLNIDLFFPFYTHCCTEQSLFTLYTSLYWTLSLFTLHILLYWTLSHFTLYTSLYWTLIYSFHSIHIAVLNSLCLLCTHCCAEVSFKTVHMAVLNMVSFCSVHCCNEHCLCLLYTHCCTLFTLYILLYWRLFSLCTHRCTEHCLF